MHELVREYFEVILNPTTELEIYQDGTNWIYNWDQGLLTSIDSSVTIVAFIVTKNVRENVRLMTWKLQKRELEIYQAYNMIDQTKECISGMRDEIII